MFLRQTLSETRRTLATPAFRLGLTALTLLLVLFTMIRHARIAGGRDDFPGGLASDMVSALVFYSWIGCLVYSISAAVITASCFPSRSNHPRPLVLSRLVVVLAFGLFLAFYAVIASLIIAALSRLLFFGRIETVWLNWIALAPAALRLFWISIPYLALTMLLAALTRSPVVSAVGTVLYATLIEGLVIWQAGRFPFLARYLPGQLARSLLENLTSLNRLTPPPQLAMPEPRAVLIIGLLSLSLFGAAMLISIWQDWAR